MQVSWIVMDMHLRGMVALKVKATGSKMFWHPLSGERAFLFFTFKKQTGFQEGLCGRESTQEVRHVKSHNILVILINP